MPIQILQESALAGGCAENAALPETRTLASSVCLHTVAAWIARSGQRKALRELAQEGWLLADIGLTREQALCEAAKRFWQP